MSRTPRRPKALVGRVFTAEFVTAQGILTKDELRSRAWRQLFHGVYADAAVKVTHRLRCYAVAAYLLPAGGAIAGRSAAALYGTGLARADDPVEVLVPSGVRFGRAAGTVAHCGPFEDADVRLLDGVRVTTPVRTCWDLSRWLDVAEAVVLIDRMLSAGSVSAPQLTDYAVVHAGDRGSRAFDRAVGLCDAGAESPPESRLRVRLVLAGLPRPTTQFVIVDRHGFLARVDLAWADLKVAVEYDGEWHADAKQLHRDRRRLNRLVNAGWIVLHVTAARMRDDFPAVVAEIREALRRARAAQRPR